MLAKELSLSDDDRDIAAYALHGIFSVSFYISTLLFTSWILGLFHTTMTIAATVALLRTFMGGAHASTAWRCGIIGAFLMNSGAIVAQALYKLAILQNDWVQLGVTVVMVGIALGDCSLLSGRYTGQAHHRSGTASSPPADLGGAGGGRVGAGDCLGHRKGVGPALLWPLHRTMHSTPLGDAGRLCLE